MRRALPMLAMVACSSRGEVPFPDSMGRGTPLGTSLDDLWWLGSIGGVPVCDESGQHLIVWHPKDPIDTSLPCEHVSAAPAGPDALWIAGSMKLVRLDADGTEEDHTSEVMLDGAYRQVTVASFGEHAWAADPLDPAGRVFRLQAGAFVPSLAAPVAVEPVVVMSDGSLWAYAHPTDPECGQSNEPGEGWFCGGAAPAERHLLLWDGTSWQRATSILGNSGVLPSPSFEPDDMWTVAGKADATGTTRLVAGHWDGLAWSLVDMPMPPVDPVYRLVSSDRGLVAVGYGGSDLDGRFGAYSASRLGPEGWGEAEIFGSCQAGSSCGTYELQDGTLIHTGTTPNAFVP